MQKERNNKIKTRDLVTLAVLCAIGVASRVAFIMVPHFKPVIGIVMITGMAFGARAGFITGAMTAFVSNFMFGQGPWTLFQMLGYGMGGALAGLAQKYRFIDNKKRLLSTLFAVATTLLVVGPILDTSTLVTAVNVITVETVSAVYLAGLPINLKLAIATGITVFVLGKPMTAKLERMKVKYGVMNGTP